MAAAVRGMWVWLIQTDCGCVAMNMQTECVGVAMNIQIECGCVAMNMQTECGCGYEYSDRVWVWL